MEGILKDGYGIMPNVILKDQELSSTAKLVYVLISSLCAKEGYCFASNGYIGRELGLNPTQVSEIISSLEKYLVFENRTSHKRRMFLREITIVPSEKAEGQPTQKAEGSTGVLNSISKNSINKDSNLILSEKLTEEDFRLTNMLFKLVFENYPYLKPKEPAEKDYREMNRINRIDGRDYKLIEFIINWSQHDDFWCQNIRSVQKLRAKFEDLMIRAGSEMKQKQGRVAVI